jgi:hypothetical protein
MNHRPTAPAWVLLVAAPVLAALAACGSTAHPAASSADGQPTTPPASSAATAPPSPTGNATATPTPTEPAAGSTRQLNPPPSTSPNCLRGTVQIDYPSGDNPLRSVCVHIGTRIQVTLRGAPGYPWRPVTSSGPRTLTLTTNTVTAGNVHAAAQALVTGTAVLSSTTRPAPEPTGPMTKRWQLTVTIVP